MGETETGATPLTAEDLRSWLVARVAYYLGRPAEEIDLDASLAEYGLDSVYAFALCGDIEDKLGVAIEPTLLWDVDTLGALTARLDDLSAKG